jgi:hypothetical protein
MMRQTIIRLLFVLTWMLTVVACQVPGRAPGLASSSLSTPSAAPGGEIATALPPQPETLLTFRVKVPANTPPESVVYMSILDEVTGLAWNAQLNPMQPTGEPDSSGRYTTYLLVLPQPIGSQIKYRYERQAGPVRVAEHLADGSPVRYRLYSVEGQGMVDDVISRWTDTSYESPSGRIMGSVSEASSGKPLPDLLVCAGGAQTFTASDGTFVIEKLPPGVHNLVVYAMDGAYHTFQQGAQVAAESTTPASVKLHPASFVNIIFAVRVPKGTPPIVPLRLAGNLASLGNSFANLSGGVSTLAVNMPVMTMLPDGRYTLTISLPVGADVRYKYTLGDGLWNAEHAADGSFRVRQLLVPDHTVLVEDSVDSWYNGHRESLTFDVTVPADTPAEDFVAIQFNPLIGWTEPVPMWRLGDRRWAYVLYSPLDVPGFSYRYCRNGQCGFADDQQTPGLEGAGRPVQIGDESQTFSDQVEAWAYWSESASASLPTVETSGRGENFGMGVEFIAAYHPSWKSLLPIALNAVQQTGANWLVLTPTWSYGRMAPGNAPPVLMPLADKDALWLDMSTQIQQAQAAGLDVALFPTAHFATPSSEWWATAPREDPGWWPVWFAQYRTFALHHADLAQQTGARALILGGDWLLPALPGGKLADGTPSGVPADAETRWRDLIGEVRSRFEGNLLWAVSERSVETPPPFLDAVDQLYLTLDLPPGQPFDTLLGMDLGSWLDGVVWPLNVNTGKPVTLAVSLPANPDLQIQVDLFHQALNEMVNRDWIVGFIARGFYPPAALQDPSASIHGKPASQLLAEWFAQLK